MNIERVPERHKTGLLKNLSVHLDAVLGEYKQEARPPNSIRAVRWLAGAVCFLIVILAFWLAIVFATYQPACCADDSVIKLVAKNLASGNGYATSVNGDHYNAWRMLAWEPGISTGPPVVLVGALADFLTGGRVLPASSQAFVILNFALAAFAVLLVTRNWMRRAVTMAVFWGLSIALFSFNWEQVGSFLGELPAALFTALGALVFIRSVFRNGNQLWPMLAAGALFGSAFSTKMVAAVAIAGVLAALLLAVVLRSPPTKLLWKYAVLTLKPFVLAGAGAAAIVAAIEIWKFLELGAEGYVQQWKDFLTFGQSVIGNKPPASLDVVRAQEDVFTQFTGGLPATVVAIGALVAAFLTLRKREREPAVIAAASCATGGAVLLLWWLLQADSNLRYTFIGVFLIIFAISIWIGQASRSVFLAPVSIAIALVVWINAGEMNFSVERTKALVETRGGQRLWELRRTVEILESPEWKTHRPIITFSWATAADIQVALPTALDFVPYRAQGIDYSKRHLVAVRKAFMPHDGFPYVLTEHCKALLDGQDYLVAECGLVHPPGIP